MIIPLTNCVFPYSQDSYKKFKVDFEKNKVKLIYFYQDENITSDNYFYIIIGEIKDEATSNFLINVNRWKKIEMKEVHSMLSIKWKIKKYIIVIGGWDYNQVEYINSVEWINWFLYLEWNIKEMILLFIFLIINLFMFLEDGIIFTIKCVDEVERYKNFNSEKDDELIKNGVWENSKIKRETISL